MVCRCRQRLAFAALAVGLAAWLAFAPASVRAADGDVEAVEAIGESSEAAGGTDEVTTDLPEGVVARVNGEPIPRAEFHRRLVRYFGPRALEAMIQVTVIRQEAARLNIEVTDREVEAAAEEFYARGGFPEGMPLSERKQRWNQVLAARGLTPETFRHDLENELLLKKIVARRVEVTGAEIREEFRRRYGERLVLRQIVVPNEEVAREVHRKLTEGASFAELARSRSVDTRTALDGGRLPQPISRGQRDVVFENVAFDLAVGETSEPFETDNGWAILKLERRIEPADVDFGDVSAEIRDELREEEIRQFQPMILSQLVRQARIERAPLIGEGDADTP